MSQHLSICATQTGAEEAYGKKVPEIKVTTEAKSVTTLSSY